MSEKGVHVVHAIANGGIRDEDGEDRKSGWRMSAGAAGRTYCLWLHRQDPSLWTRELNLRPALEKFGSVFVLRTGNFQPRIGNGPSASLSQWIDARREQAQRGARETGNDR